VVQCAFDSPLVSAPHRFAVRSRPLGQVQGEITGTYVFVNGRGPLRKSITRKACSAECAPCEDQLRSAASSGPPHVSAITPSTDRGHVRVGARACCGDYTPQETEVNPDCP
jgi:hypothetical protein